MHKGLTWAATNCPAGWLKKKAALEKAAVTQN